MSVFLLAQLRHYVERIYNMFRYLGVVTPCAMKTP